MTTEQIQPTVEELEAGLVSIQSDIDAIKKSTLPIEAFTGYKGLLIARHALTQALEIAKGESVVVPREPTKDILQAIHEANPPPVNSGHEKINIANRTYKAMISAAEGE